MKRALIVFAKMLVLIIIATAFLAMMTRVFPPPRDTNTGAGMVIGVMVVSIITSLFYFIGSLIWRAKESFFFKVVLVTNLLIAIISALSIAK